MAGWSRGVICTRITFSSPGRAVIRCRFTQGVSLAKASPAGAARSRAGRRSHSGIGLPVVEEPPACRGGDQRERDRRDATGSHDLPGAGLARMSSCLTSVGSESVIASVPVSGVDSAGDQFGRGQASGAALGGVDRAAVPGGAS